LCRLFRHRLLLFKLLFCRFFGFFDSCGFFIRRRLLLSV
jgi:hypothetical protein